MRSFSTNNVISRDIFRTPWMEILDGNFSQLINDYKMFDRIVNMPMLVKLFGKKLLKCIVIKSTCVEKLESKKRTCDIVRITLATAPI